MTIQQRTTTITGVFAETAETTIPTPPVAGTSYRDESLTEADVNKGWKFKTIVDSAQFNQALYEYSSVTKQLEIYGFLPWSDLTDYESGSFCLGTDGILYQAKQATGPSTTAYNPVMDASNTYWQPAPMNFNIVNVGPSGSISLKPNRVYKADLTADTVFVLPTPYAGIENQIKIYLKITGTISINYGTTDYFYGEAPILVEGNYVLYYDYDWNKSRWICGFLPTGAA